jgi:hypothetical protein
MFHPKGEALLVFPARSKMTRMALAAICVFGFGGMAWFLRSRPLIGAVERTYLCAGCALQRVVSHRSILQFRSASKTNDHLTGLATLLAGSPPQPCQHSWIALNMAEHEMGFRPLPTAVSKSHTLFDVPAFADQPFFRQALAVCAATNLNQARDVWSEVLLRVQRRDQSVGLLKELLNDPYRQKEVLTFLSTLPSESN